jgi:hypothetical protein
VKHLDLAWTCADAIDTANEAIQILRGSGVLVQAPHPDSVDGAVIHKCSGCSAGKPKQNNCGGWVLRLANNNMIRLRGAAGGKDVFVRIAGTQDFRHAVGIDVAGAVLGGQNSLSLSVLDGSGQLLTRQHSDTANPGQRGSVGHIQVGGIPEEEAKSDIEWLDVPRWPSAPYNLVLMLELAVYSIAFETWLDIRERAAWREAVQRSEHLTMSLWWTRQNAYLQQRSSRISWLAEQCNETNPWSRHGQGQG